MKLYQTLTEKQMDAFLKKMGSSLQTHPLTEILNKKEDFYGDFIVVGGYKFKKVYGQYNCMETPTEKHERLQVNFKKAPNDHYKKQ